MTDDAGWDIVSGVGMTALSVAAFRAIETLRRPPLVRDPYAAAFVLASGVDLPVTPAAADGDPAFPYPVFTPYIGVRSRFFDEFCAAASAAGIRQVVILGAGLDTRAFRLDWPDGTTVHEVDTPLVLGFKDRVLASRAARARCLRYPVTANLREDWLPALLAAGFSPSRPTAWLAEGLLPYLTDEGRASLLAAMTGQSAPGSVAAIENPTEGNASMRDYAAIQEAANQKGVDLDAAAVWADDPSDDPAGWLAGHGWSVTVRPAREVAREYGRPLSPDLPATMLSGILITATRVLGPARRGRAAGQPDPGHLDGGRPGRQPAAPLVVDPDVELDPADPGLVAHGGDDAVRGDGRALAVGRPQLGPDGDDAPARRQPGAQQVVQGGPLQPAHWALAAPLLAGPPPRTTANAGLFGDAARQSGAAHRERSRPTPPGSLVLSGAGGWPVFVDQAEPGPGPPGVPQGLGEDNLRSAVHEGRVLIGR